MTCTRKNCGGALYSSGLCSRHYMRRLRTGSCEDGPRARLPFEERLWKYIDKRGARDCWPWIGKQRTAGYGSLGAGGRDAGRVLAHRAVWEIVNGPIPERDDLHHGWVVMHTCDNRLCCNPRHLRLGTQSENVRDMDRKGRRRVYSPPGSKRPQAKHTEKQIAAFLRDKNGTIKERAARHGVTLGVAKMVLYGKRWRHVK